MNVPPVWAVLHCGVAKRRAGAEPAAMLAQACDKGGRKAGYVRKVEAVEEKHRLHGIEEQVITSFIQFKCAELSKDKMCITKRASLMATRQHSVGSDHLVPWVRRSICVLVIACWRSHREE